jgi:ferredoxin-NADP reductase
MKAKIKEKREVAKGTLEITYDLLDQGVDFKPGQYFYVTLPGNLEHHFTIVSSPTQKGILMNTTRVRDTEYKKKLAELPEGVEVEVGRIEGDFVLPQEEEEEEGKELIFIALGIGITPYMSMLRYIKDTGKKFKITLIYSDSDTESMAYLPELEHFETENENFRMILTVTKDETWEGEKRHVDIQFLKDYFDDLNNKIYYISGPPKAVFTLRDNLIEGGIPKDDIKAEDFSGY